MNMPSMKKSSKDSNWAYLPDNFLNNVLDRLVVVSDYVRFAAVCKPWLTAARLHHKESSPRQFPAPMLLVPIKGSTNHSLYSLNVDKKQLVLTKSKLNVPYYDHMSCLGYSHGWLIFNRTDEFFPILFNPLTSVTILLPRITGLGSASYTFMEFYDKIKVFLSQDPSLYPDTYQVLALYKFNTIYLFRSGSDSWIQLRMSHHPELFHMTFSIIDDAIYYRGNFYITCERHFFRVEYDNSSSSSTQHAILLLRQLQCDRSGEKILTFDHKKNHIASPEKHLLAESCNGDLLYIEKLGGGFRVYRVNLNHGGPMISLMLYTTRLDRDETLLLGFGNPLSVLAGDDFSDRPTQQQRVYFRDRGNIANFFFDITPCGYVAGRLNPEIPPPIWIVPNPNLNPLLICQVAGDQ